MSLWRVEEAAEYLGIRPKTLYDWVRSGRVPHRKIGFNVRFDREEIEAWVAEQSRRPEADADRSSAAETATAGSAQAAPRRAEPEPAPRTAPTSGRPKPADVEELRETSGKAAAALRRLQQELGTHLSFPERQQLAKLAERLETAVAAITDDAERRGR